MRHYDNRARVLPVQFPPEHLVQHPLEWTGERAQLADHFVGDANPDLFFLQTLCRILHNLDLGVQISGSVLKIFMFIRKIM